MVGVEADKVEVQGKQMVEERQGAWELHYSNAEIMLREDIKKSVNPPQTSLFCLFFLPVNLFKSVQKKAEHFQ